MAAGLAVLDNVHRIFEQSVTLLPPADADWRELAWTLAKLVLAMICLADAYASFRRHQRRIRRIRATRARTARD